MAKTPGSLANAHLNVAQIAAIQYAKQYGGDSGEYLSAAYLGLLDAERRFRADLASFRTYANIRAFKTICDDVRHYRGDRSVKRGRDASFVSVDAPNRNGSTIGEGIPAHESPDEVESSDAVEFAIDCILTMFSTRAHGKLREALRLVAQGYGINEASRMVGRGDSWIASMLFRKGRRVA